MSPSARGHRPSATLATPTVVAVTTAGMYRGIIPKTSVAMIGIVQFAPDGPSATPTRRVVMKLPASSKTRMSVKEVIIPTVLIVRYASPTASAAVPIMKARCS